nr:hypothetical protein [Tanacetum cinerariifolium]
MTLSQKPQKNATRGGSGGDKLVEEFRDELLDTTIIDDEAYCNPTRDIKELEDFLLGTLYCYNEEKRIDELMVKWKFGGHC